MFRAGRNFNAIYYATDELFEFHSQLISTRAVPRFHNTSLEHLSLSIIDLICIEIGL